LIEKEEMEIMNIDTFKPGASLATKALAALMSAMTITGTNSCIFEKE
jgi:hypothetical protein